MIGGNGSREGVPVMNFRLLGPLEVGHGRTIHGRRERKLLGLLLLHSPGAVSGSTAAEWTLGADRPGDEAVYVAVSRLRRQLRDASVEAMVERRAAGLQLRTDLTAVDSARFVQLVEHARSLPAGAERVSVLRDALSLWRGDVLAGEDLPPHPVVTQLTELRLNALEDQFALALDLDDGPDVLGELLSWCERSPHRERLWALAMTGLYRQGRQVEALTLVKQARRALTEELGLDPSPQLVQLESRILRHDPTLLQPLTAPRGQQPSRTTHRGRAERPNDTPSMPVPVTPTVLIGRHQQLSDLVALLEDHRLVTIVGTGGVGKTRLALRLAHDLQHRYRDGAHVVDLAAVTEPRMVATAVVEALELARSGSAEPLDTLITNLADRRALLVLDNCEHLAEAAARITRKLLDSTPVTVLTTSRQPLHLAEEVVLPLAPLAVRADRGDEGPAMKLFRTRAAMGGHPIADDECSRAAIAQICTTLDGLPLAIELAAARVRSMSLTEINERLDRRFRLLTGGTNGTPGRHRTLQAAVSWSYQHLDSAVRTLFDHIAVFVGGFDLDDAIGMLDDDEFVVLDGLDQLIDRSLLVADHAGDIRTRYTMLESLRQYGIDRLTERGTLNQIRDRHLAWLQELTTRLSPQLQLSAPDALQRIDRELANIRGALDWATHDSERAARGIDIVLALGRYWYQRGITAEAAGWIQRLRQAQPHLTADTEAQVLCELGFSLLQAGDAPAALEPLDTSLALARQVGDPALVTKVLHYLTRAGLDLRDPDELLTLIDEGRAIAQRIDDPLHSYLHSIIRLIWFIFYADAERTQQIGCQFVADYQHHPSPHIAAHVHETAAWLALLAGDADTAGGHLTHALTTYRDLNNPGCSCHALESYAWWHAVNGNPKQARLALNTVLSIRERDRHHRARYESVPFDGVVRLLNTTQLARQQNPCFGDLPSGLDIALTTLRTRETARAAPQNDNEPSSNPGRSSKPAAERRPPTA